MLEALIDKFARIEDPRCDWRVEHKLLDILVIAVCAVIGEAESFEDIALYGRCKRDWLGRLLELPGGIPSHDTFRRVPMLIDPERFERCFLAWVRSVFRPDAGAPRRIAIDGRTVRRSFDRRNGRSPLPLVSAFAVEHGLVLAQRATDAKRGELTVLPDLLDGLDLRGCLVGLDALACRPAIAARITARGGDYLLALKGNRKKAHAGVKRWFEANAFLADPCGPVSMPLTRATAGWCAGASSPAPSSGHGPSCSVGQVRRRCSRSRISAASTARARSPPRSVAISPAAGYR